MISNTAIRNIMMSATEKHISQNAIYRMSILVEDFILATTVAADYVLEDLNRYRVCQGLRPRKRLTEEDIEEVIRCTFD